MKKKGKFDKLADTFFGICEERLRPLLNEYGLRRTVAEAERGYSYYTVVFQNETTAVRVYFEWREKYLEVMVCRLVDGEVQRDSESLDAEWTCFHVADLLSVRAPEYDREALHLSKEWKGDDSTMEEIAERLSKHADVLRSYGQDVLQGDFSVFPQLDKIAKQRARERQAWYEEATAWMNKRTE